MLNLTFSLLQNAQVNVFLSNKCHDSWRAESHVGIGKVPDAKRTKKNLRSIGGLTVEEMTIVAKISLSALGLNISWLINKKSKISSRS